MRMYKRAIYFSVILNVIFSYCFSVPLTAAVGFSKVDGCGEEAVQWLPKPSLQPIIPTWWHMPLWPVCYRDTWIKYCMPSALSFYPIAPSMHLATDVPTPSKDSNSVHTLRSSLLTQMHVNDINLNINSGPLVTLSQHNVGTQNLTLTHSLFLKKRWGYGLDVVLPNIQGDYIAGWACYKQIGDKKLYTFYDHSLFVGKLFPIRTLPKEKSAYWIIACSIHHKEFAKHPPRSISENTDFHDYKMALVKLSFVADGYRTMRGIYTLRASERLPEGGSVALLIGRQKSMFKNRGYFGVCFINNILYAPLTHLHLHSEVGTFIHKQTLEEGVLKLACDWALPPLLTCYAPRTFMHIDYIVGFRMPSTYSLAFKPRDPESLEKPDNQFINQPIHARLNASFRSMLHAPLLLPSFDVVSFGFVNFMALYDQGHSVLNATYVADYGLALQIAHRSWEWLEVSIQIGHSPFFATTTVSARLSKPHFKNRGIWKPMAILYN